MPRPRALHLSADRSRFGPTSPGPASLMLRVVGHRVPLFTLVFECAGENIDPSRRCPSRQNGGRDAAAGTGQLLSVLRTEANRSRRPFRLSSRVRASQGQSQSTWRGQRRHGESSRTAPRPRASGVGNPPSKGPIALTGSKKDHRRPPGANHRSAVRALTKGTTHGPYAPDSAAACAARDGPLRRDFAMRHPPRSEYRRSCP